MGPDKLSSLTTTSYYVKSVTTGKFFYTDDVVQPPTDVPTDIVLDNAPIYLEERGDQPSAVPWSSVPTRRLRGKTAVPAISVSIEGEDLDMGCQHTMSLNGCAPTWSLKVSMVAMKKGN